MIRNTTRKTILAESQRFLLKKSQQGIGLMFTLSLKQALVFVFTKPYRVGVTMAFVFYPIDAIFLNSEYEVIEMKKHFLPFSDYVPKAKAAYLIEARSGTISSTKTRIGDRIAFETGLEGAYAD